MLASNHLTTTAFHNYDIDPLANSKALGLVKSDPDLSKRMAFHTTDIMNVTSGLKEYEVVFLAALVGMDKFEKVKIIEHLAENMNPGAILMLRSAHGARAFLYPVVDPCDDLVGFEVLSVFHPTDEVINSVVIARRSSYSSPLDQKAGFNVGTPKVLIPNKCSEVEAFNPLNHGNNMIEELVFDQEQLS